ncbi:MAG: response regulator [Bacteriovorax sp.]|nr:response regulator [Bacteriovorax sp.]
MLETKNKNNRSVFVVEDDLELSSVIDRILISIDPTLHLEWATTAEEALTTLIKRSKDKMQNPYELIICDIFLEGASNGLDLWKYCQKNFPTMKVVIISGIEPLKLQSLLGVSPEEPLFLSKPFSVTDCSNLLEKLLIDT